MIRLLNFRAMLYGVLGLVSFAFLIGIGKNLYQDYLLHSQAAQVQATTQQLQKNNEGISQLIQSFQQDSTVELEGRKDLNLQKPGEQAVIIVPPKNYPKDDSSMPASSLPQAPGTSAEDNSLTGQIAHRAELWREFIFHK